MSQTRADHYDTFPSSDAQLTDKPHEDGLGSDDKAVAAEG